MQTFHLTDNCGAHSDKHNAYINCYILNSGIWYMQIIQFHKKE